MTGNMDDKLHIDSLVGDVRVIGYCNYIEDAGRYDNRDYFSSGGGYVVGECVKRSLEFIRPSGCHDNYSMCDTYAVEQFAPDAPPPATNLHTSVFVTPEEFSKRDGFHDALDSKMTDTISVSMGTSNTNKRMPNTFSRKENGEETTGETETTPTSPTRRRRRRKRVITPVQRRAANGREKRRMVRLNEAFDHLRMRVQASLSVTSFCHRKRKLSRTSVLQLAVDYITQMKECIFSAETFGKTD